MDNCSGSKDYELSLEDIPDNLKPGALVEIYYPNSTRLLYGWDEGATEMGNVAARYAHLILLERGTIGMFVQYVNDRPVLLLKDKKVSVNPAYVRLAQTK